MAVGGQRHAPAALPPQRPGTHCIGGWVDIRARLDGRKISSPPGFDPRTVQPVASRYTTITTQNENPKGLILCRVYENPRKPDIFFVLLTVHLSIILSTDQLNAQILMFMGPCIIFIVE